MPTPIGAAAVLGSEIVLDRMPDPEISYPAGTDLRVRIEVPAGFPPSHERLAPVPADLAQWVAAQPTEVYLPDQRLAGDMIHLVFVGSRRQVESAFLAAGWTTPVPLTRRSFAHMYAAYNAMKADPTAPIAPLTYRGSTSTLDFQRTLNTVAKRHHIRIWPGSFAGTEVWLAAATHDTSITLDRKHMKATHRIDPLIDRERTTVVNDLASAGCVAGVGSVERPLAVRRAGAGKPSVTDGSAALLFLADCSPSPPTGLDLQEPRRTRTTIAMRRFFLEDRQYLMRDNVYYWLYRAGASLVKREFPTRAPAE